MYTCLRRRLDDLRGASRHRPIMAGGFVKSGLIAFQNVAERPGLTHRHHIAETPAKRFILEAKIQGVCLLEYENDGWLTFTSSTVPFTRRSPAKLRCRMWTSFTTITMARSQASPERLGC